MFPDDPLPIPYSKTTGDMTVEFYFDKEKFLVSNIIIQIPKTFRF